MAHSIAVIGGGFIGQSNAVFLAKMGFNVTLIDVNSRIVGNLKSGTLVVREEWFQREWEEVKHKINVTSSYEPVSEADTIIISVNTPLKAWGDKLISLLSDGVVDVGEFVDLSPLEAVSRQIAQFVKPKTLISLETTIYPGGTTKHLISRLEEAGLSVGGDVYVVHAPERIDPGNESWRIESIPRAVGAPDKMSLEMGVKFYGGALGLKVCPVSLRAAEAAKVYENAYRLVNIAFAQEALKKTNVNFIEVIRAVKTKPFGIQVFYPGPYAGGTCLVKDSLLYYSSTGSEIVKRALIINEEMPRFYAEKIYERIQALGASRILILGLGYKPNAPYYIGDHLNPVARVIEELRKINPSLVVHRYDPLLPEYSDIMDPSAGMYDVVLKWGYEEWLTFITS